jgi:hypothetical protein
MTVGLTDQPCEILYTPVEEALEILRERRRDRSLVERIEMELGGDIPRYLLEQDCFVLPRHIATPNNEALHVLEQAERYGAMAIFSQDLSDTFTSVNNLKRRLARPEICIEDNGQQAYRKVDLVDIPKAEGLPLRDVQTRDGRLLAQVHNGLFDAVNSRAFRIVHDADWIDRNCRGQLPQHYARYLMLFIAHGIMFEEYDNPSDIHFKDKILQPIISAMTLRLGAYPLIVRSHSSSDSERLGLSHREELGTQLQVEWR